MPEIIFEDQCQSYSHIWDINSEDEMKLTTTDGFDFTAHRHDDMFSRILRIRIYEFFHQILCHEYMF